MHSVTDADLMAWFPQEHSQEFYYATGIIGLICTMLLIRHMNRSWDNFASRGQRLRYMTLLYFIVLVTSATVEQVGEGADVNLRNIGAIFGLALGIYTSVVSLREDLPIKRKKD